MEAKLENLIEKIKLEGVQEAKKQSDDIIAKAKEEASSIVITARNEAEQIVENAKIESEKFRKNAESAIQQGARDVVLVLKEKIRDLFDRVFKMQIHALKVFFSTCSTERKRNLLGAREFYTDSEVLWLCRIYAQVVTVIKYFETGLFSQLLTCQKMV